MDALPTIEAETKQGSSPRHSKDGKWRSFPKVPNLIQYTSTGNYYGRLKVNGKIIRKSLKTEVWTTAKLRLGDFLRDHREEDAAGKPSNFSEAAEMFLAWVRDNTAKKPRSKDCGLTPKRNG